VQVEDLPADHQVLLPVDLQPPAEQVVQERVAVVMAHRPAPLPVEQEPRVQVEDLPADHQVLLPVDLQPPAEQVVQGQPAHLRPASR
jgi:hypothetical protein